MRSLLPALKTDVRDALRNLRKGGSLTLAAVLTLALGIGGTAAVFAVVNAVLLSPLPFAQQGRLVDVTGNFANQNLLRIGMSVAEYQDLRDLPRSFEAVGAWATSSETLERPDAPAERVPVGYATAGLFRTLGVAPLVGRTLEDAEDLQGADAVVVLGEDLWRRHFGADPGVVGRQVTLEGVSRTVVGVVPARLQAPFGVEAWNAMGFTPAQRAPTARGSRFLHLAARLAPGVTPEGAQRELDQLAGQLREQHAANLPSSSPWTLTVRPLRDRFVGDSREVLWLLMGAVVLLLLIACANVASLQLARAAAREGELAVRAALGAGRARLARMLLTESVVLGVVGGVAGLLLARWGVDALLALEPGLPRFAEVRLDGRVLAGTALLSVLVGVGFGLAPALKAPPEHLHGLMVEAARGTGVHGGALRRGLVSAQVALALLLLAASTLMLRSIDALSRVDLGFREEGVLTAGLSLPDSRFDTPEKMAARVEEVVQRLEALPGVEVAGTTSALPLTGRSDWSYTIEGAPTPAGQPVPGAEYRTVSAGFLPAMGARLLEGRHLAPSDRLGSEPVVVVSESLARAHFPGASALDRRLRLGGTQSTRPWARIVGVVKDLHEVRAEGIDRPTMYFPVLQQPRGELDLALRSRLPLPALQRELEASMRAWAPELPLEDVRPMAAVVSEAGGQRRFTTVLLGLFAGLALTLALVGLNGVVRHAVVQRTREVGIRMALGATGGSVLWLILRQALVLVGVGVGVGLGVAALSSRVLEPMLYGVSAHDPLTFLAVGALLAGSALLAAALPARKATRVSPSLALRAE